MPRRTRPEVTCPPDHTHGKNSTCRSLHGCICAECKEAAAASQRRAYWANKTGVPLMVASLGAHRRIRALQCLGWSASMIAERAGKSESWVGAILRAKRITPATHATVDEIFRALQFTIPQARTKNAKAAVTKTRRYAASAGWAPPLAYDDIDDPTETPKGLAA